MSTARGANVSRFGTKAMHGVDVPEYKVTESKVIDGSRGVHVCVPVIRRYDLLREMLLSLRASAVIPSRVYVIDNGRNAARLKMALAATSLPTDVYTPTTPMGVAESWNWFQANVPEERVIVNDDILLAPESLGAMIGADADLVWASGFSCFVWRDSCVEKLGLFDETISPGYGYYEDDDYLQRLDGRGTREPSAKAVNIDCGVLHLKSATLKSYSNPEMQEHHRKFLLAQANYIKKWHLEETFK